MASGVGAIVVAPQRPVLNSLADRLALLQARMAQAGGDRPVTLVAVTKGFGPQAVSAAVSA